MQIDRLLYPVHSLGPGDRLAIWIRGCKKDALIVQILSCSYLIPIVKFL